MSLCEHKIKEPFSCQHEIVRIIIPTKPHKKTSEPCELEGVLIETDTTRRIENMDALAFSPQQTRTPLRLTGLI